MILSISIFMAILVIMSIPTMPRFPMTTIVIISVAIFFVLIISMVFLLILPVIATLFISIAVSSISFIILSGNRDGNSRKGKYQHNKKYYYLFHGILPPRDNVPGPSFLVARDPFKGESQDFECPGTRVYSNLLI